MRKRMPSTNALRAFETIMKRKSVKDAADEISLTPQAVRYQIKMLEELIGYELFIRNGNRLEPTLKAIELLGYITQSLDVLEEGLNTLDKDNNKLYLHVSPYYANNILIPQLHEFTEQHPNIDLRISIGAENNDFDTKDIDIASRSTDERSQDHCGNPGPAKETANRKHQRLDGTPSDFPLGPKYSLAGYLRHAGYSAGNDERGISLST